MKTKYAAISLPTKRQFTPWFEIVADVETWIDNSNCEPLNMYRQEGEDYEIIFMIEEELSPEQVEIKRLRKVLYKIVNSRPDKHMSIEDTPELTNWICDTCHDAHVGAFPPKKQTEYD
jgi:hypothetical protein